MKILFVCTGNTCRSPMAEAICNKAAEHISADVRAFSRGTSVFFEEPINPKASEALRKLGIENFAHMSAGVSEEDIKNADLVLTMTASHKMTLKSAFPKYASKIFTLNEKSFGKDKAISDPYGQGQEAYDSCASEITEAIENFLGKYCN